jgi:hypothetical protein
LDEESCNSESESKQLSTRKLFSSSQSVPRRGCNVTQVGRETDWNSELSSA